MCSFSYLQDINMIVQFNPRTVQNMQCNKIEVFTNDLFETTYICYLCLINGIPNELPKKKSQGVISGERGWPWRWSYMYYPVSGEMWSKVLRTYADQCGGALRPAGKWCFGHTLIFTLAQPFLLFSETFGTIYPYY